MILGSVRGYDELVRRLIVTAIILIAYRLGTQLPLPGIAPDVLSQLRGAAPEHVSILALGITPYVTVLILAELVKVLFPALRRWEIAEARHHVKLGHIIVGLSLLAAAAQASGLVLALEDVANLVPEPGTPFRLASIITLVAGTALVIWLADQITRHGMGSGVWLLLAAPWITAAPVKIGLWLNWRGSDTILVLGLVLMAVLTLIIVGAIVALLTTGGGSRALSETSLWAILLGNSVWPWVVILLAVVVGQDAMRGWLNPTSPVALLLLAGLVAMFAVLYARSWREAGTPRALPFSSGLLATALGVITFADMFAGAVFPGLMPLAGHSLIIGIVILEMLQRWWVPPFPLRADTATPGT